MSTDTSIPPARSTTWLDAEAARINRAVTDSRARVAAHERELAVWGSEVLAQIGQAHAD